MRFQILTLTLALAITVFCTGSLLAGQEVRIPAPEIDGASMYAGLVVLSAGALIVRSRMRK